METVTLDGETYVKASVVAKQFGYTPDYIGQLCRAKKVDARLVGRTWFVNPRTLTEHRAGKYQKSADDHHIQNAVITKKNYSSRVAAPSFAIRKPAKMIVGDDPFNVATSSELASPQYEPDDFSLIPTVKRSDESAALPVQLVDALKVHIQSDSHEGTTLEPDELPEVSLAGSLIVADVEDQDSVDSSTITTPTALMASKSSLAKKSVSSEISSIRDNPKNKFKNDTKGRASNSINTFTERLHSEHLKKTAPVSTESTKVVEVVEENVPLTLKLLPAAAFMSAFLLALTLFSLQSVTLVSLTNSQSFLQLDFGPARALVAGESLSTVISIFK